MKKYVKVCLSIMLAFVLVLATGSSSFAASKKETSKTKTTITKNSTLYKELDKNGMFDYEYYKTNNPDVVAALGSSYKKLFNHFIKYGIFEGRQPNADFNVNAYASSYSDLQQAFSNEKLNARVIDYYTHYITFGKTDGRTLTTIEKAEAAGVTVENICVNDTPVKENSQASKKTVIAPSTPVSPAPAPNPAPAPSPDPTPAPVPSEAVSEQLKDSFCLYTNAAFGAVPHTYTDTAVISEETATTCAKIQRTCTRCGHTSIYEAHNYKDVTVVEATSEYDGYSTFQCVHCGKEQNESKTVQHYTRFVYEDPCDEYPCGAKLSKCINCGEIDAVQYLHTIGETVVIKEATSECCATVEAKCRYCGVSIKIYEDHRTLDWEFDASASVDGHEAQISRCINCPKAYHMLDGIVIGMY